MAVAGEQTLKIPTQSTAPHVQEGADTVRVSADEQAAPGGWFDCNVNYCGPAENGVIFIHLRERNGQFDRWYQAYDLMKRDMLATALTAISTGLPVTALLSTTDEYGTLNRIYVHR